MNGKRELEKHLFKLIKTNSPKTRRIIDSNLNREGIEVRQRNQKVFIPISNSINVGERSL